MKFDCFRKNESYLFFLSGMAAALLGSKAVKSGKTRELFVKGLAKGITMHKSAQESFQNMKEEAQDICHDAKKKAVETE